MTEPLFSFRILLCIRMLKQTGYLTSFQFCVPVCLTNCCKMQLD